MRKSLSKRLAIVIATAVALSSICYQKGYAKENSNTAKVEQKAVDVNSKNNSDTTKAVSNGSDLEPPTIDYSSFKINKKTVKPGDKVEISFKVTDNKAGIGKKWMNVSYVKPISKDIGHIYLHYNSVTDRVEGTMDIMSYTESGKWNVNDIVITDNFGNQARIINKNGNLLDALSFEVVNPNSQIESPEIDLDTLSVSKKNAKPGDIIEFKCKCKGNPEYLRTCDIEFDYEKPITKKEKHVSLAYNPKSGYFEGTEVVGKYYEEGEWKPISICLYEKGGKKKYYIDTAKLNALSFNITGTDSDIQTPKLDLNSLKIDKKDVKVGDTVKLSFRITDDKSGVNGVGIRYYDPITKPELETFDCKYNEETGYYETNIKILDGMQEGKWQVYDIYAMDEVLNIADIENIDGILDAFSFTVHYKDDNIAPVINAKDRTMKIGDKFNPLEGVTASDKEDGDLTNKIEIVENTVDTTKSGEYKVVYKVTDSNGLSCTKEIKVTVEKKDDVVIPEEPATPVNPPQEHGKPSQEPVVAPSKPSEKPIKATIKKTNSITKKEVVKNTSVLPKTGGLGSGVIGLGALSSILSGVYIGSKGKYMKKRHGKH